VAYFTGRVFALLHARGTKPEERTDKQKHLVAIADYIRELSDGGIVCMTQRRVVKEHKVGLYEILCEYRATRTDWRYIPKIRHAAPEEVFGAAA
jgi:hypothetical protein